MKHALGHAGRVQPLSAGPDSATSAPALSAVPVSPAIEASPSVFSKLPRSKVQPDVDSNAPATQNWTRSIWRISECPPKSRRAQPYPRFDVRGAVLATATRAARQQRDDAHASGDAGDDE